MQAHLSQRPPRSLWPSALQHGPPAHTWSESLELTPARQQIGDTQASGPACRQGLICLLLCPTADGTWSSTMLPEARGDLTMYARHAAFVDDLDMFDASLFR